MHKLPADANLRRGVSGREFVGGATHPETAHTLGVFVEDLLSVDETNDAEVLAMIDRHTYGRDVEAVDDSIRKSIRDARRYIAELYLYLGLEGTASQISTRRIKLVELLERLQGGDTLEPKYPEDFPECLKPGPMFVNDVECPPLTELDRILAVLMQLDRVVLGTPSIEGTGTNENRELVWNIVEQLRAKSITVPLAAAKISYALNMFKDGSKKDERSVRSQYDSALKKR